MLTTKYIDASHAGSTREVRGNNKTSCSHCSYVSSFIHLFGDHPEKYLCKFLAQLFFSCSRSLFRAITAHRSTQMNEDQACKISVQPLGRNENEASLLIPFTMIDHVQLINVSCQVIDLHAQHRYDNGPLVEAVAGTAGQARKLRLHNLSNGIHNFALLDWSKPLPITPRPASAMIWAAERRSETHRTQARSMWVLGEALPSLKRLCTARQTLLVKPLFFFRLKSSCLAFQQFSRIHYIFE